ncbi:hypothetical protein AB3M83_13315 [Microbacterium sp. 179-B 1A2 NHS]|uniref:hypothetical protein n=1 Tax=Microbacterium sp. 179-B 1A2 NHS TaxID=3142383 RepID=UPI00399FC7F5
MTHHDDSMPDVPLDPDTGQPQEPVTDEASGGASDQPSDRPEDEPDVIADPVYPDRSDSA